MARSKKNYLNGSLYGNFNSNPEDKFSFLLSNLVDTSYDYMLGTQKQEFKAIVVSGIATGQNDGGSQYPGDGKLIERKVGDSVNKHLALKIRPTSLGLLPEPYSVVNRDVQKFNVCAHEWAVSDKPVANIPAVPAGSEITCFYADGRSLGFSERQLFFKSSEVAVASFLSLVSQPFSSMVGAISNVFDNNQDISLMSEYDKISLYNPPRWNGAIPTIPQAVITSPFGPRRPPTTSGGKGSTLHGGIDIAGGNLPQYPGGKGSPIFAVNDGRVSAINPNSETAGKMVFITHPGGWQTEYMHMDSILVRYGPVVKGQCIGTMGTTGNSSGVHLHFTVRKNGKKVDPLLVFGWGYSWARSSTEAAYRQRLQAAGLTSAQTPKESNQE